MNAKRNEDCDEHASNGVQIMKENGRGKGQEQNRHRREDTNWKMVFCLLNKSASDEKRAVS
jgi:hypothetical protein